MRRDLRHEIAEWVDGGPGSVAMLKVRSYRERDEAIGLIGEEVALLDGALHVWTQPPTPPELAALSPDHDCAVVKVEREDIPAWGVWLNVNRERCRAHLVFLLVLVFEDEFSALATRAPDFMSWAKVNSTAGYVDLPKPHVIDVAARCLEETGMPPEELLRRWRAGELPDTLDISRWANVLTALEGA